MKSKAARILSILISVLVLFASCGQLGDGGETAVTINLPYVAGASRAIDSGKKDGLIEATKSYRVHMNDRVLEGTGGNFSAYFAVGIKVDIYVECLNSNRDVIVRTGVKSIIVASGGNSVDFNLMTDGNEITPSAPPPPPAPPTIEYVNITFNQGFVYTNSVTQPTNTWQAMTGATLPNSGQREKGSSASSDQATATGYVFKGWVESNVQPSGDAPDIQSFNYVQNYDSDMTLYAIWEQLEPGSHSVKFAGGTTTGSSASGLPQGFQQKEGTQATFSGTPTCPGYEFAGWNANVPGVNVTQQGNSWTFTMPTSDVTLTAQWNVITYTLSYEANDGQATPAQTETFTVDAGGANVTLKDANTFTRTGYTLSQWNAGNNNWSPSTSVAKTSLMALATGNGTNRTITLTAQWTAINYKIVYNGNSKTSGTVPSQTTYTVTNNNVQLADVGNLVRTNYKFLGWNTTNNATIALMSLSFAELQNQATKVDDNNYTLTLYAVWTPTYSVTYAVNGGQWPSTAPAAQRYAAGDTVTITDQVPTKENFEFTGWKANVDTLVPSSGDTFPTSDTFAMPASAVTLTAQYTRTVRTVLYEGGLFIINEQPENRKNGVNVIAEYDAMKSDGSNYVFSSTSNIPWYTDRASVISVEIASAISPTSTAYWFVGMTNCTSINLTNLNTSNVTNMRQMFYNCSGLTRLDLSSFNTSNVTDMNYMFRQCSGLPDITFGQNFNTSMVTTMSYMFYGCSGLTSLDVSKFDTSKVTDMSYMFNDCSGLQYITFGQNFNTSNVTTMSYMFKGCSTLTSLNLSSFNTSNVTTMSYMFKGCSTLTSLNLNSFNTSNVTTMSYMFDECSSLTNITFGQNFITSSVTGMYYMFNGCSKLTTLDVSSFDTSKVTTMCGMFYGCPGLTSLDLRNFNTSNVTSMGFMFNSCYKLTTLDLSSFDTSRVTDMGLMFSHSSSLKTIYVSNSFVTNDKVGSSNMFIGCTALVGGQGTYFSSSYTDKTYARIDDPPDAPGYFTDISQKP